MTHYLADFIVLDSGALPNKAICACGHIQWGRVRADTEAEMIRHTIKANAAERANEKDREGRTRPNIRSRDLTRRVFEMELPLAGKLSDLVAAIGRMESHHDEVKLAAATEIEYKIEEDSLVLYYGANLG